MTKDNIKNNTDVRISADESHISITVSGETTMYPRSGNKNTVLQSHIDNILSMAISSKKLVE